MNLYGLIGYPLGHSFSAKYFSEKFNREKIEKSSYKNFPLKHIEEFLEIIKNNPDLCGLNVTIPYKVQIMNYLDEIDEVAAKIGAVNTIKIKKSGSGKYLTGYNTDAPGFLSSLKTVLRPEVNAALILGTGGASKAIEYALSQVDIQALFVSRAPIDKNISYADLNSAIINDNLLIINTSPLGTFPNIEKCPNIPYNLLSEKHILFDLVYNPEYTLFMKKGKEMGATTINGYQMLVNQAEESWKIWTID